MTIVSAVQETNTADSADSARDHRDPVHRISQLLDPGSLHVVVLQSSPGSLHVVVLQSSPGSLHVVVAGAQSSPACSQRRVVLQSSPGCSQDRRTRSRQGQAAADESGHLLTNLRRDQHIELLIAAAAGRLHL